MVSIWTRFVEEAGHDLGLGMVVGLDLDNGFVFSFAEPVHRVKGLCDRPKPSPHLDVQHIEELTHSLLTNHTDLNAGRFLLRIRVHTRSLQTGQVITQG